MTGSPKLDSEIEFPDTENSYIQIQPDQLTALLAQQSDAETNRSLAAFFAGLALSVLLTSGLPAEPWQSLALGGAIALAFVFAWRWWSSRAALETQRGALLEGANVVTLRTKGFKAVASGDLLSNETGLTLPTPLLGAVVEREDDQAEG